MRKKFLSYITMVIVMFVVGVNVVKAEDYNFSFKVIKVDDPLWFWYNFKDISDYKEIKNGGSVKPGEIIAVGIDVTTKNSVASAFEVKFKWDNEVLEPWSYNGSTYVTSFVDEKGIMPQGWTSSFGVFSSYSYYFKDYPTFLNEFRDGRKEYIPISKSGILYWTFFKVKEDAFENTEFIFSYPRVVGVSNQGRNLVSVSTTSMNLKVSEEKTQENLIGDLNNNGKIDFGDVCLMIAYVGRTAVLDESQLLKADLTDDGKIDVLDQVKLNNIYYKN